MVTKITTDKSATWLLKVYIQNTCLNTYLNFYFTTVLKSEIFSVLQKSVGSRTDLDLER